MTEQEMKQQIQETPLQPILDILGQEEAENSGLTAIFSALNLPEKEFAFILFLYCLRQYF